MPDFEELNDDVDYMHPFGKPEEQKNEKPLDTEDAKPDAKRMKYALEEADGHSMDRKDPFLEE